MAEPEVCTCTAEVHTRPEDRVPKPKSKPEPSPRPNPQDRPENDGMGYYTTRLTGPYASLNIAGIPPLFILKEEWDDKPRRPDSIERYHQVVDTRTRLQMILFGADALTSQAHALVEWREQSSDDDEQKGNGTDEDEEMGSIASPQYGAASNPEYSDQLALKHADIAGWSKGDTEEDEEVLSINSSEAEAPQEEPEKVYYPLFKTVARRDKKTIALLEKIANCDDGHEHSDLRGLASKMLAEIQRVDDIPTVSSRF
ncbi:hypothetical protein RhiJN_05825 [Ceratobasidium sp. AG-Ba]|nr:hypothetical protein RhiJN_05825 [Ceratobasidium sp. AG-Ba]